MPKEDEEDLLYVTFGSLDCRIVGRDDVLDLGNISLFLQSKVFLLTLLVTFYLVKYII